MIKVENVHKQFGGKQVLCGVNFEVSEGESVAIIGGSGTGKSVLLKTMVGLIKLDSGSVKIDEVDIRKCSSLDLRATQKKIGYVFQEAALFDSLNVFENVAFGLKMLTSLTTNEIRQRTLQCLSMVGLENIENLKPSELSGGMKKRVGLARAIAYKPRYIFCDEPTTGLDPIMSNVIGNLIVNLKNCWGITSIVVTHDMKYVYKVANKVLMLCNGNIAFSGTPSEMDNTKNEYMKQFVERSKCGPIVKEKVEYNEQST
ncbi:MAG: ABC transporter ATP-binding protein [Endomicrobium sp.]|jgi:phospholipid/cholesterol/gamma-HCH transport system ATP-binding protein|nr:ABC transporter ATP-binding protein [Endomicrobium sp.]